jgi:hypothetical protein
MTQVLSHILEVTNARPRGQGRWMGHGICHGSKRNRDLSIRTTNNLILLHDFAGCSLIAVCAALGIHQRDLFFNSPAFRGSRPILKPKCPDRFTSSFQFELGALDRRLRANRILEAAKKLDAVTLSDAQLDRALSFVAQAYADMERAEMFEQVADSLRMREYRERMLHEERRRSA